MAIDLHIQTKMENDEVKIARHLENLESTTNREIYVFLQELRHIIRFYEEGLYLEWGEEFNEE